jgi:hypothetical protein
MKSKTGAFLRTDRAHMSAFRGKADMSALRARLWLIGTCDYSLRAAISAISIAYFVWPPRRVLMVIFCTVAGFSTEKCHDGDMPIIG